MIPVNDQLIIFIYFNSISVDCFHRDYTPELELEFLEYKSVVVSGNDPGFGSLMSRLEAALSVDAHANEAVVKKCSNSSVRRKESKIRRAKKREEEGSTLDTEIKKERSLPS